MGWTKEILYKKSQYTKLCVWSKTKWFYIAASKDPNEVKGVLIAWCGCVGINRVDISISARTLWRQFEDAVPLSEVRR